MRYDGCPRVLPSFMIVQIEPAPGGAYIKVTHKIMESQELLVAYGGSYFEGLPCGRQQE